MQREYKIYTLPKDYDLEKCLNEKAAVGWRVVQCLPVSPHFSNNIQPAFLLERERATSHRLFED